VAPVISVASVVALHGTTTALDAGAACAATGPVAATASPAAAAVMTIVGNFTLMYIPPDSDLSYFERTRITGRKSLERQGDSHERGESAKAASAIRNSDNG
jgi:hypothetical protein